MAANGGSTLAAIVALAAIGAWVVYGPSEGDTTDTYQPIEDNPVRTLLEGNGTLDKVKDDLSRPLPLEFTTMVDLPEDTTFCNLLSEAIIEDGEMFGDEQQFILLTCDAAEQLPLSIVIEFNNQDKVIKDSMNEEMNNRIIPVLCAEIEREFEITKQEIPMQSSIEAVCTAHSALTPIGD